MPIAVAADGGAHGIDAGGWAQVVGELDIGGRKADRAAAPVTLLDATIDLPGAAEQRRGGARLALYEEMADAGRRVDLASLLHRLKDGDAEAERLAHSGQQRGVAVAAVAEDEIVADDGLAYAEPGDQHVAHEILGAQRGEFEVEMKIVEQGDAETAQQLGLDAKWRQAERWQVRLKDAARMRFEGEDRLLCARCLGEFAGLGDDELMA